MRMQLRGPSKILAAKVSSGVPVQVDAIFRHESQKDRALFPGADPREFWQRAEDRNMVRPQSGLLSERFLVPSCSGKLLAWASSCSFAIQRVASYVPHGIPVRLLQATCDTLHQAANAQPEKAHWRL